MAEHVALVTGGAGGIGSALTAALAESGAFVLVAGRDAGRCERQARRLRKEGGEAAPLSLDVTDPASVHAAVERARELSDPVDWLVNNAGWVATAPLTRADDDHYRAHLEVNFLGARRVLEALLPGMLERGAGSVVQVASSASLRGYPYVTAYAAAKHALLGYSRSAALELDGKGVAVNVVCPHYVDSPMTDANVERMRAKTGRSEEDLRAFLASENPGGVLVGPGEVAEAALALLEGERTGVVLELVGGGSREVDPGWSRARGGGS